MMKPATTTTTTPTTTITTTASLTKFTSSKFLSTAANKEDSIEERLTPLKSILDQEGDDFEGMSQEYEGFDDDFEDISPSSDNPAWPNVV